MATTNGRNQRSRTARAVGPAGAPGLADRVPGRRLLVCHATWSRLITRPRAVAGARERRRRRGAISATHSNCPPNTRKRKRRSWLRVARRQVARTDERRARNVARPPFTHDSQPLATRRLATGPPTPSSYLTSFRLALTCSQLTTFHHAPM